MKLNKQVTAQVQDGFVDTTIQSKRALRTSLTTPLTTMARTALLLPLFYGTVHAATPVSQVIDPQQAWQETLNQQRIDTLRKTQTPAANASNTEIDSTEANSSDQTVIDTLEPSQAEISQAQPKCLPFEAIQLTNLDALSSSATKDLMQQSEQLTQAPCITVTAANNLARQITQAYLDEGYFKVSIDSSVAPTTATASSMDSINAGNIAVWEIKPARIVGISNHTKLPTQRLFGDSIGKPANIAWMDQAVSHAERLIDGQLILDIYPVGDDVRIALTQQGDIDTFSGDIEWYRDPDDSFGHHKIRLHTTLRNVFGQADMTSISIEQGLTDSFSYDDDNQQRSASIYTIVPNGRWQWSGLLAASDNERTTKLPNSTLVQEGDSWQANVRGDYTLARDQDSITTAYGQIAHQDVSSEVLGSKIDNQSPTISSGRLGVTHTKLFSKPAKAPVNTHLGHTSTSKDNAYLGMSGAWVVDLSAEQAFGNHDNPATEAGLSDDYLRWLLTGYLSHNYQFDQTGSVQFTHELQGQYSNDVLFAINKQSAGSRYVGVRGLSNEYNTADKGVSLRNTVSLLPTRAAWPTIGQQQWFWSPYFGLDIGWLKDNDVPDVTVIPDPTGETLSPAMFASKSDTAASVTAGLKITGYDSKEAGLARNWDLDISASRPWIDYHYLGATDSDEHGWEDTEVLASLQVYF